MLNNIPFYAADYNVESIQIRNVDSKYEFKTHIRMVWCLKSNTTEWYKKKSSGKSFRFETKNAATID